jgi:hypothetical protein
VPARQRRARSVQRIDCAAQLTLEKRGGVRTAYLDAALFGLWTVTWGHSVARRPAEETAEDVSILPAIVAAARRIVRPTADTSADTWRFWQTLRMPGEHKQERIEGDSTRHTAGSRRDLDDSARSRPRDEDADATAQHLREIGGPKGPEPTRFGDWERAGRCVDF